MRAVAQCRLRSRLRCREISFAAGSRETFLRAHAAQYTNSARGLHYFCWERGSSVAIAVEAMTFAKADGKGVIFEVFALNGPVFRFDPCEQSWLR